MSENAVTTESAGPVVLASVCDFGWGSLGKLRLILDELGNTTVALDERATSTPLVRSMLADRFRFARCARGDAAVALVINDPVAANEITACGTPVVYVDSLPYLWTTSGEVPEDVAVYCAQRYPAATAPAQGPLSGRAIYWVDPIVPRGRRRRGGRGAVLNVGGLHSHLSGEAPDAYLRLVILPLAEALRRREHPVWAVCGNLPPWACEALAEILPGCERIGRQSPSAFEETISGADLLFTSPGSTTLLQAAAGNLPTVLLPPQNLSQMLNAEIYSSARTVRIQWPRSVVDGARLAELRPLGEDAGLEYMYAALVAADCSPAARDAIVASISAAVTSPSSGSYLADELPGLGYSGASQVARVVRQAVLAPLPRPGRQVRLTNEAHGT
jgi:hydroxymethylcytosylglucuronate/cytosylglucuronate synthase